MMSHPIVHILAAHDCSGGFTDCGHSLAGLRNITFTFAI